MQNGITRRRVMAGASGLIAIGTTRSMAQGLPTPSAPVALNVIDVAGNLQLTQAGIDRFRQQNPSLVSRITYSRAPSPELPAKLKAQQEGGRVDIDLVLTGPGALSRRHTAGALDCRLEGLPRSSTQGRRHLSSASARDATQLRGRPGRSRRVFALGTGVRICSEPRQKRSENSVGPACLGQAEPKSILLCATGQLRSRLDLPDGSAAYSRRQGP